MSGGVRITGGALAGRRLPVPKKGVRPTSDKVKEAVFSALGDVVEGAVVLDMFAGSGALGLEAMSRGASAVTLVEKRPDVAKGLKTHVRQWGLDAVEVIGAPAERVVGTRATGFDLVFVDPPYDLVLDEPFWARLLDALRGGGVIVLERRKGTKDRWPDSLCPFREKTYGDTHVTFLRRDDVVTAD